jgi:hypothetical protein
MKGTAMYVSAFSRLVLLTVLVPIAVLSSKARGEELGSLSDAAGKLGNVLGSSSIRALADRYAAGGNEISGKVDFESKVQTGKITAKVASEVHVGSMLIRESTIAGDVKVKLQATTKDLEVSFGSAIDVANVKLRGATIGDSLDVDLKAETGNIKASTLSAVDVASLTITNTRVGGGVKVKSDVRTGDINASYGSYVSVGSARF